MRSRNFGEPLLLTLFFLISIKAEAQPKVNSLFSNNAVIQHGQPIRLWGKDAPGNTVVCSLAGKTASSFVSEKGDWFLELENGLAFDRDYILEVESESGKVQFGGLVLGDVWLASGQSNMLRFVNTTIDTTGNLQYLDTLQNDSYDKLRMFSIQPKQSKNEERFIDPPKNSWQKWIKMTSLDFIRYQSAVAYYTGRRLYKELDYPIGIIVVAKGATAIEEWSPKEAADPAIGNIVPESSYFNGMVSPVIPLSISGVIWYQGENNSGRPEFYAEKTMACFNTWQNRWSRDFPVFTTLLAGFRADSFKRLRSEQLLAAHRNDNFHIASAFDLGVYDDIHPYQKKDVGERLATLILNNYYNIQRHPYLYPSIDRGFIRNDSLLLKIRNSEGLKAQNEPIEDGLFQTYDQNGVEIENSATFLSDSIIYVNTFEQRPQHFDYNYVGYADNHIKLDGLPMHPYSSQFDPSFEYTYEFEPIQYVMTDSAGCYSASVNFLPTLFIDTLVTSNQIRFINVSLKDGCVLLTDQDVPDFNIYPNPSNGTINFGEVVKQAVIYAPNGQIILVRNHVKSITTEDIREKLVVVKILLKKGETVIEKILLE